MYYYKQGRRKHKNSDERGVAQFGRALRSGRRGRRFESCHLDIWPCSQAVKTSPSHGEGPGSIPGGVIKGILSGIPFLLHICLQLNCNLRNNILSNIYSNILDNIQSNVQSYIRSINDKRSEYLPWRILKN